MKLNPSELEFPLISKISFNKVHELLENVQRHGKKYESIYAAAILEKFKDHPEFKEGTVNFQVLEDHKEFVAEIMALLFPSALTLNEIKGATAPFQFEFFYTSERLENILKNAGDDFQIEMKDMDYKSMYIMACCTVLQSYYQYPVKLSKPLIFTVPNQADGNSNYYRGAFNADLMEISPTEKAIEITDDIFQELLDNYEDLSIWKKYFPEKSWEVRGLGLVNLMDVSTDQFLNLITNALLEGQPEGIEVVKYNIERLLNAKDLEISFVASENEMFCPTDKVSYSNILLENDKDSIAIKDLLCSYGTNRLLKEHKPFIISNTDKYLKESNSLLAQRLVNSQIKSYLLSPLVYEETLIGFIEIGSKELHVLNSISHDRLELILPVLSMAANRFKEEQRIRIEALIQEQCTSIHPSVKWKFEEVARNILNKTEAGEKAQFEDLIFEDIYPLYGQLDIKGSSVKRNQAVISDLSSQLMAVKSILNQAIEHEKLPAYEEMQFRIQRFLNDFEIGLFEGSESEILLFLKKEIYPTFDYLKDSNPKLSQKIDAYKNSINEQTGMIYQERKDFDESVGVINSHLAEYIDKKQVEAQKTFPHFFERYKTDGLEFNLYIGQSMSKNKKFNHIYLDNLHLWQLETMCEMEREVHQLNQALPIKLEVASLILLFSHSLSIKFRIDEKRFDVDGAYNARYEIVKKRIDKAHIKNSNERITCPGKIAIIYSSKEEANAYRKHIDYMQAKGYLLNEEIEDYELEDLQGVSGLRALRVSLDFSKEVEKKKVNSKSEING